MEYHHIRRDIDVTRFYEDYSGFEQGLGGSRALRRILALVSDAGLKLIQISQIPESGNAEWQAECESRAAAGEPVTQQVDRLDFFGGSVGSVDNIQLGASKYHGFALIRPGDYRSVLEAWINVPSSSDCYLSTVCELNEIVSTPSGTPDLRGNITAVPFLEQDGYVGSCAHASVRGATLLLARRFNTPELTFPQISEAAGVSNGSDGLTFTQIVSALEAAECNVLAYQRGDGIIRLDQIVYHFVESGFPVIVGIDTEGDAGHSLLVVGHEFDRHAWWPDAGPGYFPALGEDREWLSSAMWNGNFIVHDDNFGPYLNVHRSIVHEYGFVALVPVPGVVPLTYKNDILVAEALAALVLSNPQIINNLKYGSRARWKHSLLAAEGQRLRPVLRTVYLTEEAVREHLSRSKYPPLIKRAYENTVLSSWVYLIEVSVASAYGSLLKVGEIIIDGSPNLVDDPDRALDAIHVIHLPGMFWRAPFATDEEPFFVDTDRPTQVLTRPNFAELVRRR